MRPVAPIIPSLLLLAAACVDDGVDDNVLCDTSADCPGGGRCTAFGQCLPPDPCADASFNCGPGLICEVDGTGAAVCVPGGECGVETRTLPAAALFVLDRSCSMDNELAATGATKWETAANTVEDSMRSVHGVLHTGLLLFPDTEAPSCGQSEVAVAVSADGDAVAAEILQAAVSPTDRWFPSGPCVTNIDTAMNQARDVVEGEGDREMVAVLVTDGKQAQCNEDGGDAETMGIIADMLERLGVRTFVVGFDRQADADQLNAFANVGGTGGFITAESGDALADALETATAAARDCSFRLATVPPDANELYAFVDGEAVAGDALVYDADSRSLSFTGPLCERVEAGLAERLHVVFGCP